MTIWLLAVLLLASLAGLGYRQGAVRVGFSLVGILVGAVVAVPLGRLVAKLLGLFGLKDPLLLWALGPLVAFVVISAIFKSAAAAAHHKVDVYYKYHAGDLRTALWDRLNRRVGLCLAMLNGAAYLILIAFVIYAASYATSQVGSPENDPKWMRLVNAMGRDLSSTGLAKTARVIDRIPQIDYEMADFGALIYRNPLLAARLRDYPGFLTLAELPEFQTIATDKEFTEAWQRQDPVMTIVALPAISSIRGNPELLKTIWNTVEPDLEDLRSYLESGRSAKYDPIKILGRWQFDVKAAISAIRRAKPTMPASEMQRRRGELEATLSKTSIIAKPDNQVTLKNPPALPGIGGAGSQSVQGQWKDQDKKYLISFSGQDLAATVEGDRLTIKVPTMDLIFSRED